MAQEDRVGSRKSMFGGYADGEGGRMNEGVREGNDMCWMGIA